MGCHVGIWGLGDVGRNGNVRECFGLLFSVGQGKKYAVQIEPIVGELLRPIFIAEPGFLTLQGTVKALSLSLVMMNVYFLVAEKLRGMHEISRNLASDSNTDSTSVRTAILEKTNMAQVFTYIADI